MTRKTFRNALEVCSIPLLVLLSILATSPASEATQNSSTKVRDGVPSPVILVPPKFEWPVVGEVVNSFSSKNHGINIAANEGDPVRASADGLVFVVTTELPAYGYTVMISHENQYLTVYTHLSSVLAKKGSVVKQGDIIGYVGQTGVVKFPQLHFEVRRGTKPIDPLSVLNKSGNKLGLLHE